VRAGRDRGKPVEPAPPAEHVATSATLIVDPRAGRGRVGRELPGIEALLRERSVATRMEVANHRADATHLARNAIEQGERFVVAVGDTATVSAVLNGMLEDDRPIATDAVLGVLAANSGCDVVRTFGLPQDPAAAMDRLVRGLVYGVDVGKATTDGPAGPRVTYFLNMAQIGLAGLAARRAGRLPLGRGRSFWGYWLAMSTFRRPRIRMQGDRREFEGTVTNVIVANLQYTGNGMRLSPRSWAEDGYFDLQVFTGPRSDSFTLLPKMFVGDHLPHPNIQEFRSTRVHVDADRRTFVEADGIPLGTTPATFEVLPGILRLKT
jgi:diacylglycerol kinase (ATP)